MLGGRLRNGLRRAFANQSKLIIVGFATLEHSSHWFSELASFKREGSRLGLAVRIVVPRSTEESLAAALSADRVLEPLPGMDVKADNFVSQAVTFTDAGILQSLRVCPGTSGGITKFSEHEAD